MTAPKAIGDFGVEVALLVTEGEDLSIDFTVEDEKGAPIDISDWAFFSEIRTPDSADGDEPLARFAISVVDGPTGHAASAPIPSATTKLIAKKKSEWDLWSRDDAGVLKPRFYGPVLIRKPATRVF
jgi:hypothetical protein